MRGVLFVSDPETQRFPITEERRGRAMLGFGLPVRGAAMIHRFLAAALVAVLPAVAGAASFCPHVDPRTTPESCPAGSQWDATYRACIVPNG